MDEENSAQREKQKNYREMQIDQEKNRDDEEKLNFLTYREVEQIDSFDEESHGEEHDKIVEDEQEESHEEQQVEVDENVYKGKSKEGNKGKKKKKEYVLHDICYNYYIMKEIFSYLKWHDLLVVEKISKLWFQISQELSRNQIHSYDFCVFGRKDSQLKLFSSEETLSKPTLVITFMIPMTVHYQHNKRHLPTKIRRKYQRLTALQYMCTSYFLGQKNIVGISNEKIYYIPPINRPLLSDSPIIMSGIGFPQIPGITYNILEFNEETCKYSNLIKEIDEALEDRYVKCFFIFIPKKSGSYYHEAISNTVVHVFRRYYSRNNTFAFGGCSVHLVHKGELASPFKNSNMSIVFFSLAKGNEANTPFDAHTTIFWQYQGSEEEVKRLLINKLRGDNFFPKRQHSVCFKFSSFRRKSFNEMENDVLSQLLPDTPIIGCEGTYQYGIDMLCPYPRRKRFRNCIYKCITVMVLISWGDHI